MNNATSDNSPVYSQAFAAACLALLIWSGTTIANKVAVNYMDALSAGVLRSMMAGIIALIIAVSLRLPFPKSPRDAATLLLSGVTSFAVWPALFSLGIGYTTAGHAALITALIPVLTILFAAFLENRKPRIGWWAGAAVALVGAITLIKVRTGSLNIIDDGSSAKGDLIILSGCVTCSLGYVFGGKLSRQIGTMAVTFWGLTIALVILIPLFAAIEGRTAWSHVPSEGWLALAWMALLSSIAGYVLWFYALGRGGIGRIGSLQLAMPVMTLSAASVLLHETMTPTLLSSAAAIITGTVLAHRHAH
jgi:drug/metabolite transporter (DMT)-like permease